MDRFKLTITKIKRREQKMVVIFLVYHIADDFTISKGSEITGTCKDSELDARVIAEAEKMYNEYENQKEYMANKLPYERIF